MPCASEVVIIDVITSNLGGIVIVTSPFIARSRTREQIDNASRAWWILLITGTISIVAGGIILFADWTVVDLVAFVGALLIFRGIFTALSVPVDGSGRGWSIVLGLIEVSVGVAVWTWPGPTLLVLAAFVGWYVLFSGVMTIAGTISSREVLPYWGLYLTFGILETLLAFWLLARPGLTLVAAVLAIGFWSMTYGVLQIMLAFGAKNMSRDVEDLARDLDVTAPSQTLDAASR